MASTYKITDDKVQAVIPYVKKYGKEYKVSIPLILAVIERESGFTRVIGSSKGAQGYMQLIPKYFKGDLSNADNNIKQGVKFLATCLKKFNNNVAWALAGYNAGMTRIYPLYTAGKPIPSYTATPHGIPILKRLPYWQNAWTPKQKRNQALAVMASAAVLIVAFWYIEV